MRVKSVFGVVAIALSLASVGFAAGCGGDDETTSTDSVATTTSTSSSADTGAAASTSVGMTEFEFDPSDLEAAAGDTLTLTNDGQIPHNLTIVEGNDPLGGGAELSASDDISPGDSGKLTVDVEPGTYSFLCTIPGHAEDGMVGSITVD